MSNANKVKLPPIQMTPQPKSEKAYNKEQKSEKNSEDFSFTNKKPIS